MTIETKYSVGDTIFVDVDAIVVCPARVTKIYIRVLPGEPTEIKYFAAINEEHEIGLEKFVDKREILCPEERVSELMEAYKKFRKEGLSTEAIRWKLSNMNNEGKK